MELKLTGGLLRQKQMIAVNNMLPYEWEALNDRVEGAIPSGAMFNLRSAAQGKKTAPQGKIYQDSDLAKYLEAASWAEQINRDSARRKSVEECVKLLKKAQQGDGYINTYFILDEERPRFANLQDEHELYCIGHQLEAAVARYGVSGKTDFLEIMEKTVDMLIRIFGCGEGQLRGYSGHEEIELALAEAYEATGKDKYLTLMNYFLQERGSQPHIFAQQYEQRTGKKPPADQDYHHYQAHQKVMEQEEATGHAVRAVYLYSAMADAARLNGDARMLAVCKKLWNNIIDHKMYITGAIGSSFAWEAFSINDDLSNDLAYAESCASVGLIFFAKRMLMNEAKGIYADVMERALYNCVLAGMNETGDRFFYVNPLSVDPAQCKGNPVYRHVKTVRQSWFGTACCPPNIARLLTSLQNYVYIPSGDGLYCGLYTACKAEFRTEQGAYTLIQRTSYPWHGRIVFDVEGDSVSETLLGLRIPGWCEEYELVINGQLVHEPVVDGYIHLRRRMRQGDKIVLDLIMKPRFLQANPAVRADIGLVALSRGPLVYCAEQADNQAGLHRLLVHTRGKVEALWDKDFMGGLMILEAQGIREEGLEQKGLYMDAALQSEQVKTRIRFVPYFAWNNRGEGEMKVWMRRMYP